MMFRRRTKQAALAAVAVLGACETNPLSGPNADLEPSSILASPGSITDLAVAGTTDTSVTLTFTEVNDGTGLPASYNVRYAVAPIAWGSAADVTDGTCAVPIAGTAIGATRSCTVLGLSPATSYQFQLVAFRGILNVDAVFGLLSNIASGNTAEGPPPLSDTLPGRVTDLAVTGTSDTSATLTFTEVNDGTGHPASYAVRYSVNPISWGSALDVTRGTCTTPVAGAAIGASRSCTVSGLSPATSYQFQLVAFRGTLNVDAEFGGLSNIASGGTSGTPPPPPPNGDSSLHEPAGFRLYNDQPWSVQPGNGWSYTKRSGSGVDVIVTDATAPRSPSDVLRIDFAPDMLRDYEPSTHVLGLPWPKAAYVVWWIKLSANWTPSPAGGGKMTFLWAADGLGQVYSGMFGSSAPHRVSINTEWAPYGQRVWNPNMTETPIYYDRWYRIEWYAKWESSPGAGDGIMRWWVNGVLNGDYTNVTYPFPAGFQQVEFAPTLQLPPPEHQYMYVDHTYVSIP